MSTSILNDKVFLKANIIFLVNKNVILFQKYSHISRAFTIFNQFYVKQKTFSCFSVILSIVGTEFHDALKELKRHF